MFEDIDGNVGADCPICHKPPEDRKEVYLGTFGYREAGFPWIPSSHKNCQLRRMPKDLFWIFISITIGSIHTCVEIILHKLNK